MENQEINGDLVINVEPRHFAASNGWFYRPCPLQQAVKEMFPDKPTYVGAHFVNINKSEYWIYDWGSIGVNGPGLEGKKNWPPERIDTLAKMAKESFTDVPTVPVTLKLKF